MMMSAQDEVSGFGLKNSELVDEVITIMGAGHEVCKSFIILKLFNRLWYRHFAHGMVVGTIVQFYDSKLWRVNPENGSLM